MTFGDENSAFHRKSRSGGIAVRNQNQLFENTFQGKLSEFILYEYFKFHKFNSTEPDLKLLVRVLGTVVTLKYKIKMLMLSPLNISQVYCY